MTTAENNKRIAKNTLLLYFRMLLIMAVSLYTSRVVLEALGVEDFGIYNVVGGVVAMMGVLNNAMATSTQRYLTFELGRGDEKRLKEVFCMCLLIFVGLSVLLVILAETVGLWFVNNKMMIPADRMAAANWVYQFSILSCVNMVLMTPYNAIIIAHEKMSVYAYVSILDALLKLAVVYCVIAIPYDPLITYAALFFLASLIITLIYRIFCIKNYKESRPTFFWEKSLFKELVSYSGWNLFGSLAGIVKGQGLNILLNMFFNPAVNAARGIAFQVNAAITQFTGNFYTAVRPQIIKYYSQDELESMYKLVISSTKMLFYLILILALPIMVETPFVINLWLGQLPEHTVTFTRLIMVISAIDAMALPLMTSCHATGKIALYQGAVGTLIILNVPVSYLLLKHAGARPETVFTVSLVISAIAFFSRMWIVKYLINGFPVMRYLKETIAKSLLIAAAAAVLPMLFKHYTTTGIATSLANMALCGITAAAFIWLMGLNKGERVKIVETIKKKICRP